MNLIFLLVCLIGVSTMLKSYSPQAALARRGVYGVVVSGDRTVIEYLDSSREVERVEPAQPEPTIMISCFILGDCCGGTENDCGVEGEMESFLVQ